MNMTYLLYILSALAAWFLGLFLDADISSSPQGFLCLRILLPLVVIGLWVLKSVKDNKKE